MGAHNNQVHLVVLGIFQNPLSGSAGGDDTFSSYTLFLQIIGCLRNVILGLDPLLLTSELHHPVATALMYCRMCPANSDSGTNIFVIPLNVTSILGPTKSLAL